MPLCLSSHWGIMQSLSFTIMKSSPLLHPWVIMTAASAGPASELGTLQTTVLYTRDYFWSYHKVSLLPNWRIRCANLMATYYTVSNMPPVHGITVSMIFLLNMALSRWSLNAGFYVCHQHRGMTSTSLLYMVTTLQKWISLWECQAPGYLGILGQYLIACRHGSCQFTSYITSNKCWWYYCHTGPF